MTVNKEIKWILRCAAALSLLLGVIVLTAPAAEAATVNKTQAQAVTWLKSKTKGVDYDGAYGIQCVDLIREYTTWLGKDLGAVTVGYAYGYATQTIPTAYYTRYGNSTKPKPGDIFVFGANTYGSGSTGHVGVIYEVSSSKYKYICYNWAGSSFYKGESNGLYNFTKIIRPNFKSATTYTQHLSNDRYYIESGVGNSQYLTVYGHGTGNNVNIQTYNSTIKEDIFTVSHVSNGYYKLKNYNSGKCVDIEGSSFVSGANVHQYTDNGNDEQRWGMVKAGDGYFYLRAKPNTKISLDVKGGAAKNGTNVQVYTNNTTASQKWKFITDGRLSGQTISDGYYYIKSGLGSRYLSVNGTNVEIQSTKSTNQIFYVKYLGTGRYKITHFLTQKVLEAAGTEAAYSGTNVDVSAAVSSDRDQQWIIEKSGSAYEIVNRINGGRLDVSGGSTANGTNIQLYLKNGTNSQKFTFETATFASVASEDTAVTVGSDPTSISLDKSALTMEAGTSATLKATILPSNASDKSVTWISGDKSIATVSGGVVKAVSAGKTTIAAVSSNKLVAVCTVTVTESKVSVDEAEKTILSDTSDEAPEESSSFALLQLRYTKAAKTAVTLKWTSVDKAEKYYLYGARCGTKYQKLGELTKRTFKAKKLKKGKYYKFYVIAVSSDKKVLAQSKTIHVATKGGKIGNYKSVKLKNVTAKTITLKKGDTFKIKASAVAESKKLKVNQHRKLAYESTKPKVAKVNSKGKITAKKKGTARIYVYSQSGTFATFKVKVTE